MKKRASSFIAVLPVVIACATPPPTNPPPQEMISTNPPMSEPVSAPTTLGTPITTKPPEPETKPLTPQFPPTQYSKREKIDGKCYVQIYANPPYQAEVSCKAPIEPPTGDSKWCTVQSAKDKSAKVNVLCESK